MNESSVKKGVLIAVGELFLKSEGVRRLFKRKLVQNLCFFLEKQDLDFEIISWRGRIFVKTLESERAQKIIKRVFGLTWFAGCSFFPEGDLEQVSEFTSKHYSDWIREDQSFALRVKTGEGVTDKSRDQIIDRIALDIDRKVDLDDPDRTIFVEVRKPGWFVFLEKRKGWGGLPSGTSGKVLALISGGIDSPVGSFLAAKRGAENIWIHFHSFPFLSKAGMEKVRELGQTFLEYQPHVKIYFVPFLEIQKQIKTTIPAKYRVLAYRRMMLRIAQRVAQKEDCKALITGENLGQVSSQTLPNIEIVAQSTKMPILRPLIGFDKQQIIDLAKKIGTYRTSIKPQEDCCTLFVPEHATAEGDLGKIRELERGLKIEEMVERALSELEESAR